MKHVLSLILAVALICVLALPVSAAEDSTWVDLLEYSTVNNTGRNYFTYTNTCTFTIETPYRMRIAKVDMLVSYSYGTTPDSVGFVTSSGTYPLTVVELADGLARIYGSIQYTFYESAVFQFTRNGKGTSTVEVLSCKVTSLKNQDFAAEAYATVAGTKYTCPFNFSYAGSEVEDTYAMQFPIEVTDWQKYDSITIVGSLGNVGLNSVRVTIGGKGVPYEMTYTASNSSGTYGNSYAWNETKYYSYDESYKGTTEESTFLATEYAGKVLYTICIDLTGLDRTSTQNLYCYFTCLVNDANPYTVQVVGVTGSVNVADTSDVTWWNRFTSFMSDLFGSGDGQESIDDLGQSSDNISQGASDIHEFEQSQQDTLDTNFASIQSGVTFTNFSAALVFVQRYANMTIDGISDYTIVFTLPLFLGLFFYLCSRVPGATRWRSRPPKMKGGNDP